MKVIAHLTIDGIKETVIEGDTDVFDRLGSYEGTHRRLASIGFWLSDWRFGESNSRKHTKSKVFIPWGSILYIETEENEHT